MSKLKPCRICKGKATKLMSSYGDMMWFIFCMSCGQGIGRGTKQAVIKAWDNKQKKGRE